MLVGASACYTCRNRIPQAGWLKQQVFILSQFWELEVQAEGGGSFGFSGAAVLAGGGLLAVSSLGLTLTRIFRALSF